jgi:hypothetical protein
MLGGDILLCRGVVQVSERKFAICYTQGSPAHRGDPRESSGAAAKAKPTAMKPEKGMYHYRNNPFIIAFTRSSASILILIARQVIAETIKHGHGDSRPRSM